MSFLFFRPQSVRLRLTLWYSLALSLVLVIYAMSVYFFMRSYLFSDLDGKLRQDVEAIQEAFVNSDGSIDALKSLSDHHINTDRWLLEIWDNDRLFFSSQIGSQSRLGPLNPRCQNKLLFRNSQMTTDKISVRSACKVISINEKMITIRAARPQDRINEELSEVLLLMIIGFPAALIAAGFFGYSLARKALRPVDHMTEKADLITAEHLGERLPVENPNDELGRLAKTFNRAFVRLERSFEQMKRFTADASHELRTPLTAIRTMGEVALQRRQSEESYREVISNVLEETDRLRQLVESLLTLSRADAGQIQIELKNENLANLISEVVQQLGILCEEKNQKISLNLVRDACSNIDRNIFRQAIINLIDNAIKYSPPESSITVNLIQKNDGGEKSWCLEIIDEGPGIPKEHRSKIFDRFYRVDSSRQRAQGGAGLGLAIAKWATEVNGGKIHLNTNHEKGCSFQILMPVV